MKSFVFNVMLLNLLFYINNNEQSALTHAHTVNVKKEKKIHLDMTDWDQNGHSTAFQKSLNAVGNSF